MTLNVAFNYSSRAGDRRRRPRAASRTACAPAELDEEAHRGAPLHRRPPGAGPAHPHRRRPAHQQLPALAGRVRRAVLLRPLLARLRPGRRSTRRWPSSPAAPAASAARPARRRCASASSRRPCIVPVVVVVFLLGHAWLTLGLAVLACSRRSRSLRLLRATGLPVAAAAGGRRRRRSRSSACAWDGADRRAAVAAFVAAVVIVLARSTRSAARTSSDGFRAWLGGSVRGALPGAARVHRGHRRRRAGRPAERAARRRCARRRADAGCSSSC